MLVLPIFFKDQDIEDYESQQKFNYFGKAYTIIVGLLLALSLLSKYLFDNNINPARSEIYLNVYYVSSIFCIGMIMVIFIGWLLGKTIWKEEVKKK